MSKSRAKRKRRASGQRPGGPPRPSAAPAPDAVAPPPKRAERRAAARVAEPPAGPERPHRLDVRDGVLRPKPPWAPFPLTEIGLVVGLVIFVVGFVNGGDRGAVLIGTGALMLTVVVAEMCLREHFAGFRSHSLLLAILPVASVHTFVFAVVTDAWRGPLALFVDLSVFAGLAVWLHGRYRAAHARARSAR